MQTWTVWAKRAAFGLTICTILSGTGNGQRSQTGNGMPKEPMDSSRIGPDRDGGPPPSVVERQVKSRNEDRQKRLVSDTDKLLVLATQLHADVAKTDRNVLSLDVLHRAEEIEKLAHSVKERMKG